MPELWNGWRALLDHSIAAIARPDFRMQPLIREAAELVSTLAPLALSIFVVTLLAWGVQGGLRFRSRAQRQRVSVRRSPWLRTGWMCVKACVIAMTLASVVHASLRAVLASATADVGYAMRVVGAMAELGASRAGVSLALLVIADVIVERVLWRRGLRMTRDELRREIRDTESDRTLRDEGRRRQQKVAADA